MAEPADIGVKRVPLRAAQRLQRERRVNASARLSGLSHDAPLGRGKSRGSAPRVVIEKTRPHTAGTFTRNRPHQQANGVPPPGIPEMGATGKTRTSAEEALPGTAPDSESPPPASRGHGGGRTAGGTNRDAQNSRSPWRNQNISRDFPPAGVFKSEDSRITAKLNMTNRNFQILGFAALAFPLFAQEPPQPARPAVIPPAPSHTQPASAPSDELPRFDLDFPGGSPKDLVSAVNEALSTKTPGGGASPSDTQRRRTVNVIIPDDVREVRIPPISVKNVDVAGLFHAVSMAGVKNVARRDPNNNVVQMGHDGYNFSTDDRPARANSVWYFSSFGSAEAFNVAPTKECRFYQLAPYLETYKVDDITTAVETAWKMLGETNLPTVSFHKDTKLLIAVGERRDLALIDNVLQQLKPFQPATPGADRGGLPGPTKPGGQ
jgi:hypothetical protein